MADHMIDHLSANHVNTATTQEEKQPNEGLDVFSGFIQFMLWSSFSFARFKDDISRALWRLPLPGSIFVWTGWSGRIKAVAGRPSTDVCFSAPLRRWPPGGISAGSCHSRRTQAGVAITRFGVDFSGVPRDGLKEELSGLAR